MSIKPFTQIKKKSFFYNSWIWVFYTLCILKYLQIFNEIYQTIYYFYKWFNKWKFYPCSGGGGLQLLRYNRKLIISMSVISGNFLKDIPTLPGLNKISCNSLNSPHPCFYIWVLVYTILILHTFKNWSEFFFV